MQPADRRQATAQLTGRPMHQPCPLHSTLEPGGGLCACGAGGDVHSAAGGVHAVAWPGGFQGGVGGGCGGGGCGWWAAVHAVLCLLKQGGSDYSPTL